MNDLAFVQQEDNLAGTVDAIFVVSHPEILSIPAISAVGTLRCIAPVVLQAATKFGVMYITDQSGKLEFKTVGDVDGRALEIMLTGKFPKMDRPMYEWLRGVQNGPLLVIFRMANTGKLFVLGLTNLDKTTTVLSLFPPVYLESVSGDSGSKRGDALGATFVFKTTTIHAPIEYGSTIDITP